MFFEFQTTFSSLAAFLGTTPTFKKKNEFDFLVQILILSQLAQIGTKKLVWHFLLALFRFWAILINFRFLFFSALSQTLGKSTLGLSEAEKLAGSGEKNHPIISSGTDFRAKTKKTLFHYI